MAYNEYLQERIESILSEKNVVYRTMKMMGGLCYMVDEKMCFGIMKEDLMARVGHEKYAELIVKDGARPMDFTKRPMNGFLYVDPDGMDYEKDLEFWIDQCLLFNPYAVASKKKKKTIKK
jgi:hypothetical protein